MSPWEAIGWCIAILGMLFTFVFGGMIVFTVYWLFSDRDHGKKESKNR